eukprot:gene6967-7043_t
MISRSTALIALLLWQGDVHADPINPYGPLPTDQPSSLTPPVNTTTPLIPPAAPNPHIVEVPPAKKPVVKRPPLAETALADSPQPTLQPETFFTTAKASEHYSAIVDAGGWPEIQGPLKPGQAGKMVATLRTRLTIEGDLEGAPPADPQQWTPELIAAVKRFQSRHGLIQTGIVAGATLREMNVPATLRFRQLASSAERLAGLNFPFGDRYVVVNLPSASVEAIENNTVMHRYVAVVGDVDHRSPEVTARVTAVNLNPTWTLPTSIIKNEIIPKMRKDPQYLSRAHIRIIDGNQQEVDPARVNWNSERATLFTLRQDSGVGNSLGNIRIQMPNKDAVYMHDTPSKSQFAGDYRFFSHGCVRVQGVYDFAAWLLEGTLNPENSPWDVSTIKSNIATQQRLDVKLQKAVPVAWIYLTGWANGDNIVQFRTDVYGMDTIGSALTPVTAQADPGKPDTAKTDPAKADPSKIDPAKTDLLKSIADKLHGMI